MESTYMNTTTMSMLFVMMKPQGWAELPDEVLHSIIQLLSSTSDLLALIATCRSWRAAFMKAKASLCKLFPPLMIRSCAQLSSSEVHHTWQLMDPANPSIRFHRPVPSSIPPGMEFVRCSYGYAIFADLSVSVSGGRITLIDVFTGVQVSPPPCPELAPCCAFCSDPVELLCCTLTAPISSRKACLIVSIGEIKGLIVWPIGSEDWKYPRVYHDWLGPVDQIVVFRDKVIALDANLSLHIVDLGKSQSKSKLGMSIRPLLMAEEDIAGELENPRLMAVGGEKLALVASPSSDHGKLVFFYAEDLDESSPEPPRWSPAPELDCAIFISGGDYGNQPAWESWYGRSAMSSADPERWGAKGGHVAFAGHGDEVFPFASGRLLPSWVTPSVLCLDG